MKIILNENGFETVYPVKDCYRDSVYKVLEALSELE